MDTTPGSLPIDITPRAREALLAHLEGGASAHLIRIHVGRG